MDVYKKHILRIIAIQRKRINTCEAGIEKLAVGIS